MAEIPRAFTGAPPRVASLLAPLYIYPNPLTAWNTVAAGAPTIRYVVANPSSGPGTTVDPNYVAGIAAVRAAGQIVLGYVDTNYGAVPLATVQANIALWQSLYGIGTGIFFDRASALSGQLPYYATICEQVHTVPGAYTVLNHGVIPDPGYAGYADIMVVLENSYPVNWAAFTPPAWFAQYGAWRFCVLVYTAAGTATMTTVMTQAASYGISNVFITDETDGNWTSLPTYLAAEIQLAAS